MLLQALELNRFRNLEDTVLTPGERLNVFAGDNAQGKTNLLEAIYLIGTQRSFRATRLQELVHLQPDGAPGSEGARVAARVEARGLTRRYEIILDGPRKLARVDGKPIRSAVDYFVGVSVVLFAPEDLGVLRGSPGGRRRVLDRSVFNRWPAFLAESQAYQRVLKSRNAVLKDGGADDLLEVYDTELARHGARVISRRAAYLAELGARLAEAFEHITQMGLAVRLVYESEALAGIDPGDEGLVETALGAAIDRSRARDRARKFSSVGPHSDDLRVWLGERDSRLYASQGQLRALMLAWKIAEIRLLEHTSGAYPILLLDDVSSELDATRNAHLFEFLDEIACQCFLTTTHGEYVKARSNRKDFQVVMGRVEERLSLS